METEDKFKEIASLLSEIKSQDGTKSLLEHLELMFNTKLELNKNLYIKNIKTYI